MADEFTELVGFLTSQREDVRRAAVELVQGFTASPEGLAQLGTQSANLIPALFRLVSDADATSRVALTSLVNLSQDHDLAAEMLNLNAASRCMDYMREGATAHVDLLVMLLVNLTASEPGCAQLLQAGRSQPPGFNMALLLQRFLEEPSTSGHGNQYEHVSAILTNVTRLARARRMLLEPGKGFLGALTSQLACGSALRRRGCANMIRNCCLSAEGDGTLEDLLHDDQVLAGLLEQLCGSGGRQKDEDEGVRTALAEAVLLLAETGSGRHRLWQLKAPELLQKGYELEDNEAVCAAMERTAQLFLSDDGALVPVETGAKPVHGFACQPD